MPLYDYGCHKCDYVVEKFHKMAEAPTFYCPDCHDIPLKKLLSDGFVKRPDAHWVKDVNGFINDLEHVRQGRVKEITTREDARGEIRRLYADPYPRPQNKKEVEANKRVGLLRTRYLERY